MGYVLSIIAYLLGSIPFGLILAKKFAKVDIRTIGSKNIGATNVLRAGHKGLAFFTFFLDAMKGVIPVILGYFLVSDQGALYIIAFAAVLGHIFPVWLKFKGGKGVATVLGTLFALHPIVCAGVGIVWICMAKLFRISSLAALSAFALAPFMALGLHSFGLAKYLGVIFLLLCYTHRENIGRLMSGEEGKF